MAAVQWGTANTLRKSRLLCPVSGLGIRVAPETSDADAS